LLGVVFQKSHDPPPITGAAGVDAESKRPGPAQNHQRPGARETGAASAVARRGPPWPAVARYVALFNQRDWDALRAMLADDVRLVQSTYPLRAGAADVSMTLSP
jgi:hypothetical protein